MVYNYLVYTSSRRIDSPSKFSNEYSFEMVFNFPLFVIALKKG